jgi:peptide/nickel transport system permease protein
MVFKQAMLFYGLKRLAASVVVLLSMMFLVMLIMELIPGDPAALMLGENATQEMVEELRHQLGLDRPILTRYVEYVWNIAHGDLGRSIREMAPVSALLKETWPETLELTAAAMLLTLCVGLPIGIASGAKPGSILDHVSRVVSLLGLCMPVFWIGLVLIYFFSVMLGWFPVGGTGSLRHLVLPAVTMSAYTVASLARMTRSSLMEVLNEDYVRTARAKGLSFWAVVVRHGFRNSMIPIVTIFGMQVGQLMGGAILTETVFAWPGMGRLMIGAIMERDYPLVQGTVLVFAAAFILINFLVDLSYGWINPQVAKK